MSPCHCTQPISGVTVSLRGKPRAFPVVLFGSVLRFYTLHDTNQKRVSNSISAFLPKRVMDLIFKKCLAGQYWQSLLDCLKTGIE